MLFSDLITIFTPFNFLPCSLIISLSANSKISCSICCSSPILITISVTFISFSFSAASNAVDSIDSANAHSCIVESDKRETGLNVTIKHYFIVKFINIYIYFIYIIMLRCQKIKNTTLFVIFTISIIIFSTTASVAFSKNIESYSEKPTAKWTVMYYMCGDSNMNIYIDPLLDNLSKIGSNDNLNIVCLADKKGVGNSRLLYINESGNLIELNEKFGWPAEVDLSNLETFELFCTQMMENYSAEYYALIIYASGGIGWRGYALQDQNGSSVKTLPNFASSLDNIVNKTGHKIDVLVGSCAVNMIEIAYELKSSVNYIVGTQDCFPQSHVVPMFYYAVSELKKDTNMNAEEFAIQGPFNYEPISFIYEEGYDD